MTSSEVTAWSPDWQQHQQLVTSSLHMIINTDTSTLPTFHVSTSANLSPIRIVLITLCTFGVIFNGFVLHVLVSAKQTRRVTSNMFIINQTLADLLACLSVIVNAVAASYHEYMKLPGAIFICVIFEASAMISICSGASTANLVVLTMERYFKIIYQCSHGSFYSWQSAGRKFV